MSELMPANLGPQIKEPQQRLSDRIENDPTDEGDRDRTKIAHALAAIAVNLSQRT